jgi:N-acetylornithine carbamoyltransferase
VQTRSLAGRDFIALSDFTKEDVQTICIRVFGDPVGWVHGDGNAYMREFAKTAYVPVINMEDDMYHPCQGIADLTCVYDEAENRMHGQKAVMALTMRGMA